MSHSAEQDIAKTTGADRPKRRRRHLRNKWAYALVILQAACVIVPIAIVCVWAFTASWPWPHLVPQTLSARGMEELFLPAQKMPRLLITSIFIALATALLSTVVATMAARAICIHKMKGKDVLEFAILLPLIIPTTVFAMGVQVIFLRCGLAGTDIGVILSHTIVALPYCAIIMLDITAAAGTRMEEASQVLGASPIARLFTVTIPQLLPGMLSSMSMAFIVSFSQYFITLLIGAGKVKTLALIMFPYLTSGDRTIASAYGVVFMLVILVVFILFEVLLRKHVAKEVDYFNG